MRVAAGAGHAVDEVVEAETGMAVGLSVALVRHCREARGSRLGRGAALRQERGLGGGVDDGDAVWQVV